MRNNMALEGRNEDVPSSTRAMTIALENEPRSVVRLPNTKAHTILENRLYLGPGFCATNGGMLKQDQITHILNVATELKKQSFSSNDIDVLHLKLWDSPEQELPFERTAEFMKKSLGSDRNNRCLVHCNAGQSRSASLVIYFLMKHADCSLADAYYFVKARKPDIGPNYGFYEQLQRAELQLRGGTKNSIDMNELKAESLLAILDGSSKTRDDILKVLQKNKGDAELTLGQLLEYSS